MTMLERAQQLFQQENWPDLLALVAPLCSGAGDPPLWALQYGGAAAFHLTDLDRAEAWLVQAHAARPEEGWTAFYLGRLELQRGRYPQAITLLQTSSEVLPDQPWPRFFLVEACLAQGDWMRAFEPLRWLLPEELTLPGLSQLRQRWLALASPAPPPLSVLLWAIRLAPDRWLLVGWSTAPALQIQRAEAAIQSVESPSSCAEDEALPRFACAHGRGWAYFWRGGEPSQGWSIDGAVQRPRQLDLASTLWPASAHRLLTSVQELGVRERDLGNCFAAWLGPALQVLAPPPSSAACLASGSECLWVGAAPPERPRISVVLPLYGRWDFLRAHLMHLAAEPLAREGLLELVAVVDDPALQHSLMDWCTTQAEAFGLPFRLVLHPSNLGFAQACNSGAVEARGTWLVLLNSDVFPRTPRWLERLQAELEQQSATALVAPLLLYPDGSLQHGGMEAAVHPRWPGLALNCHPGKGLAWLGGNESREVPLLSAAVWMLERSCFLALGGLRRDLIQGDFEDSAFCHRLRQEGLSARLVPEVVMVHAERQSMAGRKESHDPVRQLIVLANAWLAAQPLSRCWPESCAS